MNAKIFLFGLVAAIWLPASVAMAGPRGSGGTASGARMSGGGFSGARMSAGTTSQRMSAGTMSQRMSAGTTSVARFSTASAGTPRTFTGATSRSRIGTGNYRAGSVGTNHWSGNNNNCNNNRHHHHHHRSFVFIGDFGYPFGYPYWYDDFYPYGYGYGYGYNNYDPAGYGDAAAYDGSLVAQVQTQLARAGYYRGPIDGVIGSETRRAIRAYQRTNGLRADGVISKPLIATMGLG
jgi:hypothetical protein